MTKQKYPSIKFYNTSEFGWVRLHPEFQNLKVLGRFH
jgi:hypothetical protein